MHWSQHTKTRKKKILEFQKKLLKDATDDEQRHKSRGKIFKLKENEEEVKNKIKLTESACDDILSTVAAHK